MAEEGPQDRSPDGRMILRWHGEPRSIHGITYGVPELIFLTGETVMDLRGTDLEACIIWLDGGRVEVAIERRVDGRRLRLTIDPNRACFHRLENVEPGRWEPGAPERLARIGTVIARVFATPPLRPQGQAPAGARAAFPGASRRFALARGLFILVATAAAFVILALLAKRLGVT